MSFVFNCGGKKTVMIKLQSGFMRFGYQANREGWTVIRVAV